MDFFHLYLFKILFFFCRNDIRKKEIWAGRHRCPRCGKFTDFHLTKTEKTLRAFFIPTMTMIDDRFISCDECGYEKRLRIYQYSKIKKSRFNDLKNRTFPSEMVCNDFSPQNLKYKSRIAKVIITSALFVFMLLTILITSVKSAAITEAVPLFLFVCLPFAIPAMLSIKGLVPCCKKSNAYAHINEFPSINDSNSQIDFHIHNAEKLLTEPSYKNIYTEMDNAKNLMLTDNHKSSEVNSIPSQTTAESKKISFFKKWIYILLGKLHIIPKNCYSNPNFEISFHKLSGNKIKLLYIFHLAFLCVTLIVGVVNICTVTQASTFHVIMSMALPLSASIGFLVITFAVASGIAHSLKTLVHTGNIKYIDEVLEHIGSTREIVIFHKHLLYDKPNRVIVAYDDIVSGYPLYDSNNNNHYTVLCTVDGRKHKTYIINELLYEFKLRKPLVIWESTEIRR